MFIADYFHQKSTIQNQKQSQARGEEEDEKDDAKFLATIRQVVGGLLLPSISVALDKLVLSHIMPLDNSVGSTVFRTLFVIIFSTKFKPPISFSLHF
jgi:hypothetical protein